MTLARVVIVGGTGYTGVELLRLLAGHPEVDVTAITSRSENGRAVADLYPNLRNHYHLKYSDPSEVNFGEADIVFFATPHGVAQASMKNVLDSGPRVVDLSADFRIRDQKLWEHWYGQPHQSPEIISKAIYGLPEFNREKIKSATLVAAPGCYPTSAQLGLKPLVEQKGLIDLSSIVINSASGVTGAGRQAKLGNLFAEVSDSFMPYAVAGHRHLPEIEQGLSDMAGEAVKVTFVPHLLPINRGILTTIYVDLIEKSDIDVQAIFASAYTDEPFVDVLPPGQQPTIKSVRGSNICRIGIQRPQQRSKLVVTVVEDNLTKGAAGQAIQCMNLMLGFDETAGLGSVALMP